MGLISMNPHLAQRIEGIRRVLMGAHFANSTLSTATKGNEREVLIDSFLDKVLPPVYRFGTGDATDSTGKKTGQLDVVVEYPFCPSVPTVGAGETRLYLAESVAAVIEVKSNAAKQWDSAVATANKVGPLRRNFSMAISMGAPAPIEKIPCFVIGYSGWKDKRVIREHLEAEKNVAGVLIIDSQMFLSQNEYMGIEAVGPCSLWAFISAVHVVANTLQSATANPLSYLQSTMSVSGSFTVE